MKFGKKIRSELSPGQLRGSVNYKALKQIAKKARRAGTVGNGNSAAVGAGVGGLGGLTRHHHHHHRHHQPQQEQEQEQQQGIEEFFARLELEKEKVQHQSYPPHVCVVLFC